MFVLELLGHPDKVLFVSGFNNTLAALQDTCYPHTAKKFTTEPEAVAWANKYAPGYNYKVVNLNN